MSIVRHVWTAPNGVVFHWSTDTDFYAATPCCGQDFNWKGDSASLEWFCSHCKKDYPWAAGFASSALHSVTSRPRPATLIRDFVIQWGQMPKGSIGVTYSAASKEESW